MASRVEWVRFSDLTKQLETLKRCDCTPLLPQWSQILVEGNRRGVLSGVDGNDQPMPPLKYRPKQGTAAGKKTSNRQVPNYGTARFQSTGAGPFATGLHDNLLTRQYELLTGPRLAPRGDASRVIKNLHDQSQADPANGRYECILAWFQVISTKGKPFLIYHFDPESGSHLPKYDLRPIRRADFAFCMNALRAFAKKTFLDRF